MKLLNFENWSSGELSKFGVILENKMIKKLMLSKNDHNKKCASVFVFFNEKKIERNLDNF
jgi:hypothetical protein